MSDCIQIIVLGLFLGSIPFGVLLAKLFKLPDPRYIGSGNIGATNMLRTGRKDIAALTLVLDMAKGAAAVLLTSVMFPLIDEFNRDADCMSQVGKITVCVFEEMNYRYTALALLAAAIGHMYSPWLKFKGGKGVATILGAALAFSWPVGMAFVLIWLIVFFVSQYVSLASIIGLIAVPLVTWLRVDDVSALIVAFAAGIAIWRHRENIGRLRRGFEPKTSFKKGGKK